MQKIYLIFTKELDPDGYPFDVFHSAHSTKELARAACEKIRAGYLEDNKIVRHDPEDCNYIEVTVDDPYLWGLRGDK